MPIPSDILKRLSENDPTLENLDGSEWGITDADIIQLQGALKNNRHLRKIFILDSQEIVDPDQVRKKPAKTQIIMVGVRALALLPPQIELSLFGIDIGDEGAKVLAQSKTLKRLSLNNCGISIIGKCAFLRNDYLVDLYMLQNSNSRIHRNIFEKTFLEIYPEISKETLENALAGNAGAIQSVLEYLNAKGAGFEIANILRQKQILLELLIFHLDSLWEDKIGKKLEDNKMRAHPEMATAIQIKRLKEQAIKAACDGELGNLKTLIPKLPGGANAIQGGDHLLLCAANFGHAMVVKYLLSCGANAEACDPHDKKTALFLASESGHDEVVFILLQHAANMSGEFDFNNEDAMSIVIFKIEKLFDALLRRINGLPPSINEKVALLNKLNKALEPLSREPVIISSNNGSPPRTVEVNKQRWRLHGDHPHKKQVLILMAEIGSFLKTQSEKFGNDKTFKTYIKWQEIVESLAKKLCVILGKKFEHFGGMTAAKNPSRFQLDATKENSETKRLSEENLLTILDKINKTIKSTGVKSVKWSDFPQLLVVQYRGVHFYRDRFTPEQRKDFLETCHLNRDMPCSAAFEMSQSTVAAKQLTRESTLLSAQNRLREEFGNLQATGPVVAHWNKKVTFPHGAALFQQRYSNSMPGFRKDLQKPNNLIHSTFAPLGVKTSVPVLSTSGSPNHAFRYAYGLKPDGTTKGKELKPQYTKQGLPVETHLGAFFVSLFPISEWETLQPHQIIAMHAAGEISIGPRILNEDETAFRGGISQSYHWLQEAISMPNLDVYQEEYLKTYNLDEAGFKKCQSWLKKGEEQEILKFFVQLQNKKMATLIQAEMIKRNAYLVYRNQEGLYQLLPPDMKTVKEKHNASIPHKKDDTAKKRKDGKRKRNLTKKNQEMPYDATGGSPTAKNFDVDIRRWYNDSDINRCLEQFSIKKLRGRLPGNNFLLQGTNADGTFSDEIRGNDWHVLTTPAIDCAGYAAPIDFYLNKLKQQAPELGRRDDRRDIFDEMQPLFSAISTQVKILFPYNLTLCHWLTGEIRISKMHHNYWVEVFAHDPYGYGQMHQNTFNTICEAIKIRVQQIDRQASFQFHRQMSYFGRRQAREDSSSCGVIVVEDIFKRIFGKSLNMPKPYPVGTMNVRKEHHKLMGMVANHPAAADSSKAKSKLALNKNRKAKLCSLITAIQRTELRNGIVQAMLQRSLCTSAPIEYLDKIKASILNGPLLLASQKPLSESDVYNINTLYFEIFLQKFDLSPENFFEIASSIATEPKIPLASAVAHMLDEEGNVEERKQTSEEEQKQAAEDVVAVSGQTTKQTPKPNLLLQFKAQSKVLKAVLDMPESEALAPEALVPEIHEVQQPQRKRFKPTPHEASKQAASSRNK